MMRRTLLALAFGSLFASPHGAVAQSHDATGVIRISSNFPFYELSIHAYDPATGAVSADWPIRLVRERWFFASRAYKTFTFAAPPGHYVLGSIRAWYGDSGGTTTCFEQTFLFQLREGETTYLGSHSVNGDGRRLSFAALQRDVEDAPPRAATASADVRPIAIAQAGCESVMVVTGR